MFGLALAFALALRWFRSALAKMVLHELDEGILIDGVRVFDPHHKVTLTGMVSP